MGEMADALLDGIFCQQCGVIIDEDAPGYARLCNACYTGNEIREVVKPVYSEKFVKLLSDNGYQVESWKPINYGIQYRLKGGYVVNIYTTGKFAQQGKPETKLKSLLHSNIYKF